MAAEKITDRLEEFKQSGLAAGYEIMEVDDSIRVKIVAARGHAAAKVKEFAVESLAGLLSDSQISVEEATE
jgi:fructose 1,6-bisphosphatase